MRQAAAVLRLVSWTGPDGSPEGSANASSDAGMVTAEHSKIMPEHGMVMDRHASAGRNARQELLKEWMGSHTRILGLWLDRLLEEGDDEDLVSMIHRQHAWLSMMQARMERG